MEDERVFVYMSATTGTAYKLARPYHGPFCMVRVVENCVEVRPVDKPNSTLVALNWSIDALRKCLMPFGHKRTLWHRHWVLPLPLERNLNPNETNLVAGRVGNDVVKLRAGCETLYVPSNTVCTSNSYVVGRF